MNLDTDEALLTGESLPVQKEAMQLSPRKLRLVIVSMLFPDHQW